MRTHPLILGSLLLTAPLAAQEACEKDAGCCSTSPQVVQVQRVQPAARALPASRPLPTPDRGYLGVRLATDENGMRILEVLPGSGAAEAGLQAGDRILTIAGTSTAEAGVQEALGSREAGEKVKVTYDRAGETRKAMVTLKTLAQIEGAEEGEGDEAEEVAEAAQIEWIENLEQDLAEEVAELDGGLVEVGDIEWVMAPEAPAVAAPDDRGYLGVSLDSGGDELSVLEVYEGSAAAAAGLRAGDVLLQFDGRKGGPEDQLEYLRGKKVGAEVQVRYRRGEDLGRTRVTLGPLKREAVSFGFTQELPDPPQGRRAAPEIRWTNEGVDAEQIEEIVRRAVGGGEPEAGIWIATESPESGLRVFRDDEASQRVRLFTTREGNEIKLEAIVEDDHDHEHEHADHDSTTTITGTRTFTIRADDDEDDEHEGHGRLSITLDAIAPDGAHGGDGVRQFVVRRGDHDAHAEGERRGEVRRRVLVKRIADGEETVEEYEFDGDAGALPEHLRELLHRHAGERTEGRDEPQSIRLRAGIGGDRMIVAPERVERIRRMEGTPEPSRRPAAVAQERMRQLQQRVLELEARITELERMLERAPQRGIRRER